MRSLGCRLGVSWALSSRIRCSDCRTGRSWCWKDRAGCHEVSRPHASPQLFLHEALVGVTSTLHAEVDDATTAWQQRRAGKVLGIAEGQNGCPHPIATKKIRSWEVHGQSVAGRSSAFEAFAVWVGRRDRPLAAVSCSQRSPTCHCTVRGGGRGSSGSLSPVPSAVLVRVEVVPDRSRVEKRLGRPRRGGYGFGGVLPSRSAALPRWRGPAHRPHNTPAPGPRGHLWVPAPMVFRPWETFTPWARLIGASAHIWTKKKAGAHLKTDMGQAQRV